MPKLCVALDLDPEEALNLVRKLSVYPVVFKVGPVLFLKGGPDLIRRIRETGKEVFLDLKVHDIPNTVREVVSRAEELGADYLTLHTLAGKEALREAVEVSERVKLVGVTLLTSHDEGYLRFLRAGFESVEEMVLHLAHLAKETGLYGVVCSPLELKTVKEKTGLFTVVPGIRIFGSAEDHRRFSTPQEAVRRGADMIVMGRDIYKSGDPERVVSHVLESIGD